MRQRFTNMNHMVPFINFIICYTMTDTAGRMMVQRAFRELPDWGIKPLACSLPQVSPARRQLNICQIFFFLYRDRAPQRSEAGWGAREGLAGVSWKKPPLGTLICLSVPSGVPARSLHIPILFLANVFLRLKGQRALTLGLQVM